MPRFDKLSDAFKDDPEFLQVMGHFYEDVLEFHRRAYKFFRRRGKLYIDRSPYVLLNSSSMIIQPGRWSLILYGKPSSPVSKQFCKA